MHVPDRVSGLSVAGLGALAAYGGSLLPPVPGQQVGPNVFPMVVGAGLILCGLLIAFGIGESFEKEAEADLVAHSDAPAEPPRQGMLWGLRALIPPALLLFYVLVSEGLGFVPTAAMMVLVMALALGARLVLAVPLAIVAPLAVHLVFAKLLRVALPPGLLPLPW
jgi:putative tricarboxylic transport membrane protein